MNENLKTYVEQLRAFHGHMLEKFNPGDNEAFEDFLEADFIISFMGKTVRLGNGAEIFQGIEELLQYEIEEWEE